MAQFPISYPKVDGPGRLLEICSFHRSKITEERYNEVYNGINAVTSKFPISRQNLAGTKLNEKSTSVIICDWTSAEEKDIFEPGEQYQSIKPAFEELVLAEDPGFRCHHIILPGGSVTPEAEVYVANFYQVKTADQSDVAALLERFASDLVKDQGAIFFHSAPSREDSEIVVAISGWSSQSAATAFLKDGQLGNSELYLNEASYAAILKIS